MTEPVQIVERYREMHQQCKLQEFSLTQYSGASIAKLIEELSTAEQENAKLREALNKIWEVASGESQVAMDDTAGMEWVSDYASTVWDELEEANGKGQAQ
jgi:hypothetical protein